MNKKFQTLLSVIIALLLIALTISISYNFKRSTIEIVPNFKTTDADKLSPFKLNTNPVATTTLNCTNGLITTTIVEVGGQKKTFCAKPSTSVYIIGNGTEMYSLLGYYSPYEKQIYNEYSNNSTLGTTTCPAITIDSGDIDFIQAFKKIISDGNTVNRFNSNKELVLNIDLNDLSLETQNLLKKSSVLVPIKFNVKVKESGEREADYCESFIKLISVNQ